MNKVLLTGASGFVGKALAGELLRQGYALNMAFRQIPSKVLARISHRKRCTGPSDARKLLCKERF
ncbi:NAD-dependent epimerase/dehydratase family protein, partial [Pseudomonas aeruginosa]|uniref:NAD-dependent epimerase/dehydratase family protein n=1 Tax=Pseudomonas aeruginosa TaxID=287 RepID=UPI0034E94056